MLCSSRLIVLIIFLISFDGASAIDVCFSASNGGESVGIWNHYLVDDSVSITEDASASFTSVGIKGSGTVSGSGDLHVMRSYVGSGGVAGGNNVDAECASGIGLTNSVNLLPGTLDATQTGSITSGDQIMLTGYAIDDGEESIIVTVIPSGSFSGSSSISAGHSTSSGQTLLISGATFMSTASATGTGDRIRIPGYGNLWNVFMQASTGAGGSTTGGTLGYHIDTHQSIQAAVDASESGDAILLLPKTYLENVYVWKSLIIAGAGADKTTVNGNGADSVFTIGRIAPDSPEQNFGQIIDQLNNIDVILDGMKITNGRSIRGGGINNYARLTIQNCDISGNRAEQGIKAPDTPAPGIVAGGWGGGFYTHAGASTAVYNTNINNNYARLDGGAFYVEGGGEAIDHIVGGGIGGSVVLHNCVISGNTAQRGGGGFIQGIDLTLHPGADASFGIVGGAPGSAQVFDSTITGNTARATVAGVTEFTMMAEDSGDISGKSFQLDNVGYGGGFFVGGALHLVNSPVTGNIAAVTGGGAYNRGTLTGDRNLVINNIPNNIDEVDWLDIV